MMTHWLKQLRGNRPALGSTAPSTPRRVRGRALRLEALEDRTTPTQLAYGLFDTAVDSTGAILTSGVDANYTITTNPDGSGPAADIITPSYGTGYISPNASGNGASGTYAYTTTFTVPVGTTMAGATITGLISADNNINDIRLDGAATGFAQISGAFDRGYNFGVDIAGLTAGTHTLTFVVQNTANGATGLKVSNLVMNVAPRSDANQPPALTGGGTPTSSLIGGPGVAIDPNLTVMDADGPDLTGAVVAIDANFTAGDVLGFTNQNGITGSYSAGNGVLTLTGSATAATYQTALRSVTIATPTAGAGARDISFSIAQGAYFAQNGHFYEFVSAPSINWGEAEAAASGRNIFGLQGYLATLQSTAENTFAADRAGAALAWLGASDAHAEGVWQHAAGPEAGVQFWQGAAAGGPVNGEYNNWRIGGEPNDAGGEDYAHFLGSAEWNDYNQTTAVAGYIVEYGGSANDPVLSLTSSTTVNAVNRTANPTVTAPGGAISINAAVISVTGTAAANSLVRVYSDANNDGIVNGIDAVVAQQQLTGGATTYSISTPLAPNAANNFVVTATVSPDFESNPVNVPTITEDSNAPTGTVVTGPAAPTSVNAATFAITGTAEANSFVRIYRDVNNNNIIDAGDTVVGSQQLVGGATTFGISVPLTQDAANNFLVTATDAAANEGAPVDVPTITEDSLAPALPVVTTPAATATVNAASALVAGTAEAGSLVRIYNDLNNNGIIDGGDSVVAQQQLGAGVTSFGISTPLTQNAANNFLVTSGDAAGNQSGPTDVPTIAEDSNAPAGPTVAGPSAPTTVNVANFAITGTAEAGSLVRVYSDANNNGVVDGPDAVVGSQQLGAGATSFIITVPLMQDAPNDFTVTATDSANNESTAATPSSRRSNSARASRPSASRRR